MIDHKTINKTRRGIALVWVMMVVSVTFIIGMSILNGLPQSARASSNLIDHNAALYLAESGMVEAMHHLGNPPVVNEVWSGIDKRSLDGSDNYYSVTVTDNGDGTYGISSSGHVAGRANQPIARSVGLTVSIASSGSSSLTLTKDAMIGAGGYIPANVRINNDVYVNGVTMVSGTVTGEVSSTSAVHVTSDGSVGSTASNVEAMELPDVDLNKYEVYSSGQAQVINIADNENLTSLTPITQDNPLGIVYVKGDVALTENVEIKDGILVIEGKLNLNGHTLSVSGDSGQISLIVTGDISFPDDSSKLTVIKGTAYLEGLMSSPWNADKAVANFQNGLILTQSLPMMFGGQINIDNVALKNDGIEKLEYFGTGGGGGSGQIVVTPITYIANAQ